MAKSANTLKVTPLLDLRAYAEGELVEFPPFAENKPFVAKLKRPSMMVLMKSGKIPNALMSRAIELFSGTVEDTTSETFYTEVLDVIEILAEASFVEPLWKDIKEAGIQLTDEQYTFLFNYTQRGIKAVEPSNKK